MFSTLKTTTFSLPKSNEEAATERATTVHHIEVEIEDGFTFERREEEEEEVNF